MANLWPVTAAISGGPAWCSAVCMWQPTHCFSARWCVPGTLLVAVTLPVSSSPMVPSRMLYCGEWCGGRLELVHEAPRWLWHCAQTLMFGSYLLEKTSVG